MNQPEPVPVTHDRQSHRFLIELPDGTAVLEYVPGNGHIIITHTFVPDSLRGGGIAGQLAKAAFEYVKSESLKIVPQCSYIQVYAARHSELAPYILQS
jgi:Predicted acetyltransferase